MQALHPALRGKLQEGALLRDHHLHAVAPLRQERGRILGRQHWNEREPRLEPCVFFDWRADELAKPVDELHAASVGQAVDGAFGASPRTLDLLRDDEPVLLQRLDNRIERAVVELDALVLASLAHRGCHLVGMHRVLRETCQHYQRERIVYLTLCYCWSLHTCIQCGIICPCLFTLDYSVTSIYIGVLVVKCWDYEFVCWNRGSCKEVPAGCTGGYLKQPCLC